MGIPQFKAGHIGIYNEKVSLSQLRKIDKRSLFGVYSSKLMLLIGIALIVLNNLNYIAPGTYFGAFSWVTLTVFSIGVIINFILIPYLYFSSYKDFRNESDFWDQETFWIMPMFFFGTFFLYGSQIVAAVPLLIASVTVISIIHLRFVQLSWKLWLKASSELASHEEYYTTLKYLTAYYILLFGLLIFCNPLQKAMVWIRNYF